jgi:hypothetical protein
MRYLFAKDSRFGSLFFLSFFALSLLSGQSPEEAGWSPWRSTQGAWDPFSPEAADSS